MNNKKNKKTMSTIMKTRTRTILRMRMTICFHQHNQEYPVFYILGEDGEQWIRIGIQILYKEKEKNWWRMTNMNSNKDNDNSQKQIRLVELKYANWGSTDQIVKLRNSILRAVPKNKYSNVLANIERRVERGCYNVVVT